MSKKYTVTVFNTIALQYEEIKVTRAVFNEFRRGKWRISKNDDKHSANETPFSSLLGGADGGFENFDEFIDYTHTPQTELERQKSKELACQAIMSLSEVMRKRLILHYEEGLTVKKIAEIEGVSECRVKDSLRLAKKKIKKFLHNF